MIFVVSKYLREIQLKIRPPRESRRSGRGEIARGFLRGTTPAPLNNATETEREKKIEFVTFRLDGCVLFFFRTTRYEITSRTDDSVFFAGIANDRRLFVGRSLSMID